MKRINFSNGAVWEEIVDYSPVGRIENILEISGTTTVIDNAVVGVNDTCLQTKTIIKKTKKVLKEAGASLDDFVRTRCLLLISAS